MVIQIVRNININIKLNNLINMKQFNQYFKQNK